MYRSDDFGTVARTTSLRAYQHRALICLVLPPAACLLLLGLPEAVLERRAWLAMLGAALSIGAMLAHGQLTRATTQVAARAGATGLEYLLRLRRLALGAAALGFVFWAVFTPA